MTDPRATGHPGTAQEGARVQTGQDGGREGQRGAQACEWCGRAIAHNIGWVTAKSQDPLCDVSDDRRHDPGERP